MRKPINTAAEPRRGRDPSKRYCSIHRRWYLPWSIVDGKSVERDCYACAARRVEKHGAGAHE